jgi:hypothetical protein
MELISPVWCVELIGSSQNVRQAYLLLSRLSAVFCPIKRAQRLLSEERNRCIGERIRQLMAAPLQVEPFQLPRSRG